MEAGATWWLARRGGLDPTMRCQEAQELFDAYLDGELSPTLATELSAHRLCCADCRRALALLEVSGHIVGSDRDPVELRVDFTDRLIACVSKPKAAWLARVRIGMYVAGPLAAAAVIVLAFLGAFDGQHNTRRAGVAVDAEDVHFPSLFGVDEKASDATAPAGGAAGADEWMQRLQRNVELKRESGASLQRAVELQLQNLLDAAEQSTDRLKDPKPKTDPEPTQRDEQDAARSQSDKNP